LFFDQRTKLEVTGGKEGRTEEEYSVYQWDACDPSFVQVRNQPMEEMDVKESFN